MRGYAWSVFGVIVLTILIIIGINIVLGILLLPFEDWLQSFLSNVVGGTLTAPFIAVTWTLLYYRLRAAKEPAAAPAGPTPPIPPAGPTPPVPPAGPTPPAPPAPS